MKKILFSVIVALFVAVGCNKTKSVSSDNNTLETLYDSFSFAVGFNYGLQLKQRFIPKINYNALIEGMKEAMTKDSNFRITPEIYEEVVGNYLGDLQDKLAEKNIEESKEFIAKKSSEPGVKQNENGLRWKVLQEGTGVTVNITDTVLAHYRVSYPDGFVFDDTREINKSVKIPVKDAWPGMVEGLQLMNKGSVFEFYVPFELGFGRNPRLNGMQPNKALTYYIELIDIL